MKHIASSNQRDFELPPGMTNETVSGRIDNDIAAIQNVYIGMVGGGYIVPPSRPTEGYVQPATAQNVQISVAEGVSMQTSQPTESYVRPSAEQMSQQTRNAAFEPGTLDVNQIRAGLEDIYGKDN